MTFWQWLDKDDNWLRILFFLPFVIISIGLTTVMVVAVLKIP